MLHRPQTLVSSSSSTTSDGRIGARGRMAWCLIARKPLFLRCRAPCPLTESGFEAGRRGASPPVNPCFFVTGHHVGWANRSRGTDGVVPHRPLALVSSSPGTTPLISSNRNSHLPQKTKNFDQGAAPAAPCRHFPFPYQSVETVPLYTLRGQSLSYPILSYPNPLLCFALLC